MTDVYGGLWFENLVAQDRHFDLQCHLFARGLIQGIQMRVAHLEFTPGVTAEDLPRLAARLPSGMPVFIHFGAENCGVDFGECFDECGVFTERGRPIARTWAQWNAETIAWGLAVAAAGMTPPGCPAGVVHPGYGRSAIDEGARALVLRALGSLDDGQRIAAENVPPIVRRAWYEAESGSRVAWGRDGYWGFGGTPMDMGKLLGALGPDWRCLIDFTHVRVASTQAAEVGSPPLAELRALNRAVNGYLLLPHWPICHFSGNPPTRMDHHGYIDGPVLEPLRDGLRTMDIVCLEVPWRREDAEPMVASFRQRYLDIRSMV